MMNAVFAAEGQQARSDPQPAARRHAAAPRRVASRSSFRALALPVGTTPAAPVAPQAAVMSVHMAASTLMDLARCTPANSDSVVDSTEEVRQYKELVAQLQQEVAQLMVQVQNQALAHLQQAAYVEYLKELQLQKDQQLQEAIQDRQQLQQEVKHIHKVAFLLNQGLQLLDKEMGQKDQQLTNVNAEKTQCEQRVVQLGDKLEQEMRLRAELEREREKRRRWADSMQAPVRDARERRLKLVITVLQQQELIAQQASQFKALSAGCDALHKENQQLRQQRDEVMGNSTMQDLAGPSKRARTE